MHYLARILFLTFAALCASGVSRADTTWVNAGEVEGAWNSDGSPYMIFEGHVLVGEAAELEIGEGTRVVFSGPYEFRVQGSLTVSGTNTDSVYFTADPVMNPGGWRGLRFDATNDCVLSYCVIEYGRATGGASLRYGGGIECIGSSPLLSNCTIRNCHANLDGGGVYVRDGSDPFFISCSFIGNHANFDGGAVLGRAGVSVGFSGCQFAGNSTNGGGGGVHAGSGADFTLMNCVFESNSAALGGGCYAGYGNSEQSITNCLFTANSADSSGGGLFLRNTDALVQYCVVYGNSAPQAGGIHLDGTAATIQNTFAGFATAGTGLYFDGAPDVTLSANSFFGDAGGLMDGDTQDEFGILSRQNLNLDSCDSKLNIFMDPLFADAAAGDFTLTGESPCIAAGHPESELVDDFAGGSRPQPAMTLPDIGLFEHEAGSPPQLCGVLEGTIGPGNFAVTCDLQIEAGTSVVLQPNTSLRFTGDYTLTVNGQLDVIGTESQPVLLTRYFAESDQQWGGVVFSGPESRVEFEYVTIEFAHASPATGRTQGGGLFIDGGSHTLENCVIQNCEALQAAAGGGGIYCGEAFSLILTRCDILNNSAAVNGGGAAIISAETVVFENCNIEGNDCGFLGGGVYSLQTETSLTNCSILNNHSGNNGGGVYSTQGNSRFVRCLISGNSAENNGGGLYLFGLSPLIDRSTIYGNSAAEGGGVLLRQSAAKLKNSICSFNDGNGIAFADNNGSAEVGYSNFFGNTPEEYSGLANAPEGLGVNATLNFNDQLCDSYYNISFDPLFGDADNNDFTLDAGSPSINAGNPQDSFDADSSIADQGVFAASLPYEPSTAFDLLSPPHDGGVSDSNFTPIWSTSYDDGTTNEVPLYQVEIALDSLFTGVQVRQPTDDTTATIGGLADSTFYWWRVRSIGSNGIARTSNESRRIYTVEQHPPTPFDLIAPAEDETLYVTQSEVFEWEESEDIDGGDFIIYSLRFVSPFADVTIDDLPVTSLNILPLVNGIIGTGEVQWWVEASSQHPDTAVESLTRRHFYLIDSVNAADDFTGLPTEFALLAAYPNPFNPVTTISFDVPVAADVRLGIYNLLGQEIAVLVDGRMHPGRHDVRWTADTQPSGVYLARLQSGSSQFVRKLMLLK